MGSTRKTGTEVRLGHRMHQVWKRGVSIPAQVSLLRVAWKDRQVKPIKCMGLSAKGLFLKLVNSEKPIKWADSFQDYLSHPLPPTLSHRALL